MKFLLLSLALIFPLSASAQLSNLPRFEDYATVRWTGLAAPVELTSAEERMFRTNLSTAAKEPPNFAGHYRVAMWGCGTRCSGGAVIDLLTGKVFPLPLAGKATGEEHWIFCVDSPVKHTIEYRRNSGLMILRCGAMQSDAEGNSAPDLYYFVWEREIFREILHFAPVQQLTARPKSR
jgi:hypothetical protein